MKQRAAAALGIATFAILMGAYFLLPSQATTNTEATTHAAAPADTDLISTNGTPVELPGHVVAAAFGCQDRDQFDRIAGELKTHAMDAAKAELGQAVQSGECTLLKTGESVEVSATHSGMARVSRKGDAREYWTVADVVSL